MHTANTDRKSRAPQGRPQWIWRNQKSRRYVDGWDNQGAYMLFDARQNLVVLGPRYDAALDEIEEWLDQPEE